MAFIFGLGFCLLGMSQDLHQPEEPESIVTRDFQFGGWFDLLYLDTNSEDAESYFDSVHMYAFADLHLSSKWRGFVEFRRINAPHASETVGFERLYLEYRHSMALKFRIGRFNTPAGLWQHMHWAYTIDSAEKPLIEQRHYFSTESDGIQIFGNRGMGKGELEYSFFTNYQGKNETLDSSDKPGYGFDVNFGLWQRSKTGIFFSQFQHDGQNLEPTPSTRKVVLAYHEQHLIPNRLLWRTEYLYLSRKDATDLEGYYTKLRLTLNRKWYLNVRYDHTQALDSNLAPYTQTAKTLTLSFYPTSHLRLRAEFSSIKDDIQPDTNKDHVSLWMGYRF